MIAGLAVTDTRGVCTPAAFDTDIFRKGDHDKMATIITDWAQWLSGQTAASGALSLLYCATAPELEGEDASNMACTTPEYRTQL